MNKKREKTADKSAHTQAFGITDHLPKMNNDSGFWHKLPHATESHQDSVARRIDLANWFYVPSWKRSVLPKSEFSSTENHWLLFINHDGIGDKLAEQLKGLGQRVSIVRPAAVFSHKNHDGDIFTIQPFEAADYLELFKHLEHHPDKIVHLWHTEELANENQGTNSFFSLLFFAQALVKANLNLPVQVGVVTNFMFDVLGGERLIVGRSTMLGPIRTIAKDIPQTTCKAIDFPEQHPDGLLLSQILVEMADTNTTEVAWRGQRRWVQTFEPVRLLAPAKENNRFKDHSIYLITDGFGTIGSALAQHFAENYQAKLVLLSRSEFPKRADWGAWLNENGNDNSTSKKILQVQLLEKSGGQILVQQGDITDVGEMEAVFEATISRFGPISAIFHTAEVIEECPIQLKEAASAERVLGAKVTGTKVLYDLLKEQQGKFMLLFSSTSSYLASPGQADYIGANAFIDSFAQHEANLAQLDCPEIFSISWPSWLEESIVEKIDHSIWKDQLEAQSISPAEGIMALSRIMHHGLHHAIVSPIDILSGIDAPKRPKSELISTKIPEHHPETDAPFNKLKTQLNDGMAIATLKTSAQIKRKHQPSPTKKVDDDMPTLKNLLVKQFVQEKSESRWLSLVKLQEGQHDNAPLFLIHGVDGDVLIYRHLVRELSKDQPVYALQSAKNSSDSVHHATIEQMAGHYTQEILRARPEGGPYMLGGYSIGGLIALETAQQLRSLGYEVSLVAMLESYNLGLVKKGNKLEGLISQAQTIHFNMRNLLKLKWTDKQLFLAEKLANLKRQITMTTSKVFASNPRFHPYELRRINKTAALDYVPQKYDGYMLQVQPAKSCRKFNKLGGSFETISKTNCHFAQLDLYPAGMLTEPFVTHLAKILSQHIEKSSQ